MENTALRGRWEWIGKKPDILLDSAHNKNGIELVMKEIVKKSYNRIHFVLGMVSDKDISPILDLLPKQAVYYFCRPNIPRGLDVNELKSLAESHGLLGNKYESVSSALEAAREEAEATDLIYVGGSTFVVAEALP